MSRVTVSVMFTQMALSKDLRHMSLQSLHWRSSKTDQRLHLPPGDGPHAHSIHMQVSITVDCFGQIWLWKFHNGVNVRINMINSTNALNDTNRAVSSVWPSRVDCPVCYYLSNSSLDSSGYGIDEGEVVGYLKASYWS